MFRRGVFSLYLMCVFGLFGLADHSAHAVTGEDFEYHGYMRAGTASNTHGGDAVCPTQSGIPGNQFRLGNECGIYGENYFQAYVPHAKDANGEFFRANFDFSYFLDGRTSSDISNFNVFGAYVEAGRLDGSNSIIWVGKRFYRDTDIHMDDLFYFADTSGTGAGIQDIPLVNGKLALAALMESTTQTDNAGTVSAPVPVPVTTENGRPRTILFDARLFNLPLDDHQQLNFWLGYATSTGGTDTVTHVSYDNARGYVGGVKYQYQSDAGYNRLAAVYGHGLMQGLNLGGTFGTNPLQVAGQDYLQSSQRWRLIDEFVFQPWKFFATSFAAIYETWTPGNTGFDSGRWASVGVRPVYFFTDHYSLMGELGVSNVKQPGPSGEVTSAPLVRATIAPQITPKSEFFARPSLRVFYTETWQPAVSYGSYGVQGEVWF